MEQLKHQHWSGVVIELVIVVLGVFIGIQVSNWNEARADARLGADYVSRLSRDLYKDLASARLQITYYDEVLRAVREADRLLKDGNADPKALVASAYRASEVMYVAIHRATWDQIVSSGHLGLLPEGTVSSELIDYYSYDGPADAYKVLMASRYRRVVRQIMPIEIQDAMRAGCSDRSDANGTVIGFMENCTLDADPALVRSTATALRQDPSVATTLRYQYSDVNNARLNLMTSSEILKHALTALGAPVDDQQGNAP